MEKFKENPEDVQHQKVSPIQKGEWIFVFVTLLVLGGIFYFPVSKEGSASAILILLVVFFLIKNSVQRDLKHGERRIAQVTIPENIQIPANMPLPFAIFNQNLRILMYNEAFETVFEEHNLDQSNLLELFPEYQLEEAKQTQSYGEALYEVYSQKCQVIDKNKEKKGDIFSICLVDVSENQKLQQQMEEEKTVIAYLFLDNYEEVLDSIDDESRLPILTALIDRKLNALAMQVGGVIRKFEKDRYIFLLSQGKLEELKEKKFEILNEIREVSVGEHIPVTMSLGVGLWQENLEMTQKSAKAAMDLALGRGGDQVLIKDGEKYLFYGGKTGEVGHNARIRARVKADALWELMGESNDVLVMGHKQADFDSLGAAIGIYSIANAMGKPCHIVLDHVSPGIKTLHERLGETEGYERVFFSGQEADAFLSDRTLVVITDTHRYGLTECPGLIDKAKKVVIFDHHRKSTDFIEQAVLIYHEPYASSTSELVTEMIQYFGKKVKLKPIEADSLLAGIAVDTKNFCLKTGAITFEAAAFLRRSGGDSIRVRKLFQNDIESYKTREQVVRSAKIFHQYYAISICPGQKEDALLTAAQAADELLNVTDVKASFVMCPQVDKVFISARSYGEVNVQLIMEKLGGGGHLSVSGAQIKDCTLEEVKEKLEKAIAQYQEEEL